MEELDPGEEFAIEFAEAEARGRTIDEPRAVAARYLPGRKMLVVVLAGGVELHVPIVSLEGLSDVVADDLRAIEITPAGTGLHFPRMKPLPSNRISPHRRGITGPLLLTTERVRAARITRRKAS